MNEIIRENSSNCGIENINIDIKNKIIFDINKYKAVKDDKKNKKYFLLNNKKKNVLINILISEIEYKMNIHAKISLLYNLSKYPYEEGVFGEFWSNYTIKMNFID